MGDFLDSYYVEQMDERACERQFPADIEPQLEEQPVTILGMETLEIEERERYQKQKDVGPPLVEGFSEDTGSGGRDEDDFEIPVASMSTFEVSSMVTVRLNTLGARGRDFPLGLMNDFGTARTQENSGAVRWGTRRNRPGEQGADLPSPILSIPRHELFSQGDGHTWKWAETGPVVAELVKVAEPQGVDDFQPPKIRKPFFRRMLGKRSEGTVTGQKDDAPHHRQLADVSRGDNG